MTRERLFCWWPLIGLVATLALGWLVGHGSTVVDDGFGDGTNDVLGAQPRWLLAFSDWWLLGPIWLVCFLTALWQRRFRVAAVVAVLPWVAIEFTELLKHYFDRHKGHYLEYPSGHTTLVVSIVGVFLLVAGLRVWAIVLAAIVVVLGILGLIACGYHYFTDTLGALLLTSAWVVFGARVAGLGPQRSAPALGSADAEDAPEKG